jgi:hypothetical protein
MEDYKDDSKDIILTLDSLIVPMFHLGWAWRSLRFEFNLQCRFEFCFPHAPALFGRFKEFDLCNLCPIIKGLNQNFTFVVYWIFWLELYNFCVLVLNVWPV